MKEKVGMARRLNLDWGVRIGFSKKWTFIWDLKEMQWSGKGPGRNQVWSRGRKDTCPLYLLMNIATLELEDVGDSSEAEARRWLHSLVDGFPASCRHKTLQHVHAKSYVTGKDLKN